MGGTSRCRIEFVLDQTDRYISISAIAQSAPDLAQGTNQLPILAGPWFGKQDAESFLKSPAPNPSIMNRIRLLAHQHLGEQGDEFLKALPRYVQKFFVNEADSVVSWSAPLMIPSNFFFQCPRRRSCFGVKSQRRVPGPPAGRPSISMRQSPPFLRSISRFGSFLPAIRNAYA